MIIKLDGITLPETTEVELEFEPNVLYDKPSITGRLHRVYKTISGDEKILFNKKFKLTCVGISKATYDDLNSIDGKNASVLAFENMQFVTDITDFDNPFIEVFVGTFSMTFSKYESSVYYDVIIIEFNVSDAGIPLDFDISSTDPADNDIDVAIDKVITIIFNKPADSDTIITNILDANANMYIANGATKIDCTLEVVSSTTYRLTPAANLPYETVISINILDTVLPLDSYPGTWAGFTSSFTTIAEPIIGRPTTGWIMYISTNSV